MSHALPRSSALGEAPIPQARKNIQRIGLRLSDEELLAAEAGRLRQLRFPADPQPARGQAAWPLPDGWGFDMVDPSRSLGRDRGRTLVQMYEVMRSPLGPIGSCYPVFEHWHWSPSPPGVIFRAQSLNAEPSGGWAPPGLMRPEQARFIVRVAATRLERLGALGEPDLSALGVFRAPATGVGPAPGFHFTLHSLDHTYETHPSALAAYKRFWNRQYGDNPAFRYEKMPWTWVHTIEVIRHVPGEALEQELAS